MLLESKMGELLHNSMVLPGLSTGFASVIDLVNKLE